MNALTYAVRLRAVLKYFGQLCFVLALMTLVPLTVSLLSGDYRVSLRYGLVIAILFTIGFAAMRLPAPKRLQLNEGIVITALIFLFTPLVMAWPAMASGLNFLDAFFETVSAVTTTGLSATATVSDKPTSFLFARAWMQWVGGLGIVVLSLAAMIQPGLVAKRLGEGNQDDYEDDPVGGTRARARLVLLVYSVLTVVGIVALVIAGTDWFEAILYTFAAVSTGSFAPNDASLGGLPNHTTRGLVIFLSLAGGVTLLLYQRLFRDGIRAVAADRQLRGYLLVGFLVTLLLAGTLRLNGHLDWTQALGHGALNALSAQSTAGFASLDMAAIDAGSKLVLMVSMFIGGSVGSTAGGIKILRLLILMRILHLLIQRTGMPRNAVSNPRLGSRRLENDEIQNALSLILVYVVATAVSWAPFVLMGHPPFDALFEVISALSTAGLSAGITGPDLHPFLKAVLCADMLLGRLEIMAWLILLAPGTWFAKRLEE
jgi:trk system potassium uptake protein TrkH